jgi:hypothetical protein
MIEISSVSQCRDVSYLVTTGHSRSKNGVASLAYDPMVHAEMQFHKLHGESAQATLPLGLPGQARQ